MGILLIFAKTSAVVPPLFADRTLFSCLFASAVLYFFVQCYHFTSGRSFHYVREI